MVTITISEPWLWAIVAALSIDAILTAVNTWVRWKLLRLTKGDQTPDWLKAMEAPAPHQGSPKDRNP
jgi:hypothetical protein